VIDWNIKSAAAALKHPVDGRTSRDWLHATDYLVYGYLQTGDDAKALEAANKIDPATKFELNSGPGAYGLAATPARVLLERRMWKEAAQLAVKRVDYTWDQYPWAEAATQSARGLGSIRSGDVAGAQAAIAELDRLKPKIESPWWQGRIQIERDVISAWISFVKKDVKQAEALMRGASDRELASGKDNVEPGHVVTAAEELGDLLIELKRPADAVLAYKAALVESPNRFNALFGAARASELAGNAEEARKYYKQLVDGSVATSTRPARAQAAAYLAKP
jgi:tetratricopeptide (TPR) repeat protein